MNGRLGHCGEFQEFVPGAPLSSVPFVAKQLVVTGGKDKVHCA